MGAESVKNLSFYSRGKIHVIFGEGFILGFDKDIKLKLKKLMNTKRHFSRFEFHFFHLGNLFATILL